ncbi:hypothetical protein Dalu01_03625 [Deinococcus aluminii]|uniref:Uncharacterized protein n=1 Tax=Deinococcus aluminii TaxID=1656885 RepID=A0ABP9XIL8_9DEIO
MTTQDQLMPWQVTLSEYAQVYGYPVETVRTWAKRGRFLFVDTVNGKRYVNLLAQPWPGRRRYGARYRSRRSPFGKL